MNVFSRLNTRAMKTPIGLVTARISSRKTAICSQPFAVMPEFLRTQQRVDEVHGEERAHCENHASFQVHHWPLTSSDRRASRRRSRRQRMRRLDRYRSGL